MLQVSVKLGQLNIGVPFTLLELSRALGSLLGFRGLLGLGLASAKLSFLDGLGGSFTIFVLILIISGRRLFTLFLFVLSIFVKALLR